MQYLFIKKEQNFSDYASGQVFYSYPGRPALPIRLTSEIFQRCKAICEANGAAGPYTIYDPCCGGAYHLSTLAYLHWPDISEIIGSDIDEEALSLAKRNFSLLTEAGLNKRITEISGALGAYGKSSHEAALESADRLRSLLLQLTNVKEVKTLLFRADATDNQVIGQELKGRKVDIIITDVPYGQQSTWQRFDPTTSLPSNFLWSMLDALLPILSPETIVAVAANKQQKVRHEQYQRLERFKVGKRQVVILKPVFGNDFDNVTLDLPSNEYDNGSEDLSD